MGQIDLKLYKQAEKEANCGCEVENIYQKLLLEGYIKRGELLKRVTEEMQPVKKGDLWFCGGCTGHNCVGEKVSEIKHKYYCVYEPIQEEIEE